MNLLQINSNSFRTRKGDYLWVSTAIFDTGEEFNSAWFTKQDAEFCAQSRIPPANVGLPPFLNILGSTKHTGLQIPAVVVTGAQAYVSQYFPIETNNLFIILVANIDNPKQVGIVAIPHDNTLEPIIVWAEDKEPGNAIRKCVLQVVVNCVEKNMKDSWNISPKHVKLNQWWLNWLKQMERASTTMRFDTLIHNVG